MALQKEKVAIENSNIASIEEKILPEANLVLQYVDVSYALDEEIQILVVEGSMNDTRTELPKKRFKKNKVEVPLRNFRLLVCWFVIV